MKRVNITVTGMSCAACSSSVEKAVRALEGVSEASVNLSSGRLSVEFDEKYLCVKDIEYAVTKIGFGVNYDNFRKNLSQKADEVRKLKKKLVFSLVFAIPLFYVSMGHMIGMPVPAFMHPDVNPIIFSFVQLLLALGCMVAGVRFYTQGFKKLFTLQPNMDSLVAVGTSAAFLYGVVLMMDMYFNKINHAHNLYFESVGVIIALIHLGKYLENRSRLRTNDAIVKLIELAPPVATVIRNGEKISVDIEDIVVGDVVAVFPGEKIPVDGVVRSGKTNVDESMLSGESIPVEKEPGSKVFAGCINKYGYIEVVTGVSSENTVISQIIKMVEEASGSKPQIAHLADKICSVFVPCVIFAALATGIIWFLVGADVNTVLNRFISVLVVACPCALGLATPTAVIVSVGRAANEGILVKDARSMEYLNAVDTYVFDKTGTLTAGEPSVEDYYVFPGYDEKEILSYAMSVEAVAEHPLSDAIYEFALSRGVNEKETDNFRTVGGRGVCANVEGCEILLGNRQFMEENAVQGQYDSIAQEYISSGKTVMFLAQDGNIAAIIAARDTLKNDAFKTIRSLKKMNKKTILLTGDNKITAAAMAKELEIDEFIAEVLPGEKAEKIQSLISEGRHVAMVGDGINDSIALTVADVGIAVGSGTQVAVEAADIVIMKDELYDIVKANNISRITIKNIKQNLFYAFVYNTVLIPVAAGVLAFAGIVFNPMLAATAMALSSFTVVLNALRLKKIKICDQ